MDAGKGSLNSDEDDKAGRAVVVLTVDVQWQGMRLTHYKPSQRR